MADRKRGPRWENLHPTTRAMCLQLLEEAEAEGLRVMFWDGWRPEQKQSARISEGVSFVSDPLNSNHPWGNAVDIVFKDQFGVASWPSKDTHEGYALWKHLGTIGERIGFEWGGRWGERDWGKFDGAHFQRPGIPTGDLIAYYGRDPMRYVEEHREVETVVSV